jgi:hypothetical protein
VDAANCGKQYGASVFNDLGGGREDRREDAADEINGCGETSGVEPLGLLGCEECRDRRLEAALQAQPHVLSAVHLSDDSAAVIDGGSFLTSGDGEREELPVHVKLVGELVEGAREPVGHLACPVHAAHVAAGVVELIAQAGGKALRGASRVDRGGSGPVELAGEHLAFDDQLEGHGPIREVRVECLQVQEDGFVGGGHGGAVLGVREAQQPEAEGAAVSPRLAVDCKLDPAGLMRAAVVEQCREGQLGDLGPGAGRVVGAHAPG